MVLLGDIGQEVAHFCLFGDSVNINTREVHGLRRMYNSLRNHFWHNRWYSYMACVKWKLVSVHLEIVLISTQDRWTVCAEYTLGIVIILGTMIDLIGDVGDMDDLFGPSGDSVNLDAR
jgi:hypothetical protein